jgi:hypothetical protein
MIRSKPAALLASENEVVPHGEVWVESDTGIAKRGNGNTAYNSLPYWTPGTQFAYTTADQSSTDGTNLSDVAGLGFKVAASGVYIFEYYVHTSSAAGTTGLALSVNGPTSPTYIMYTSSITGATPFSLFGAGAAAYDTALVSSGSSASAAAPIPLILTGHLVNGSTAGTLILRMRTEVNASAATIHRGSWGRLTRVG